MIRRPDTLDPEIARELEQLEAALAGEPGADPVLLALVADVREQAPRPAPGFAAQLDERVAAGFPRAEQRRARRPWLVPAMGLAATVLLGVVVVTAFVGGSGERAAPTASTAGKVTGSPGAGAAGDLAAPPAFVPSRREALPAPATALPDAPAPAFGRKVERSTELTLTTPADGFQAVADGVVRVTQQIGGFVASSSVTRTGGRGTATFTLRIPTKRLDDAVRRLSRLAHVGALSQDTNDITSSFVSAAGRLGDARAERRALLRALAKATTANEIASLRARLRGNRSEIAAYKGALNALRRRADFATVGVTVEGRGRRSAHTGGGAWTPRDALRDAGRVLEVAAGALLVGAAAALPVALLALLAALGGRTLRRRRREQALDIT